MSVSTRPGATTLTWMPLSRSSLARVADSASRAAFASLRATHSGLCGDVSRRPRTLAEAGRYVVLCAIPVGADPDEVAAAMQSATGGPPDLGDGPPHFTEGMVAELVVEPA